MERAGRRLPMKEGKLHSRSFLDGDDSQFIPAQHLEISTSGILESNFENDETSDLESHQISLRDISLCNSLVHFNWLIHVMDLMDDLIISI